jgi:L-ribulose-5-phosphate 3-epimerase
MSECRRASEQGTARPSRREALACCLAGWVAGQLSPVTAKDAPQPDAPRPAGSQPKGEERAPPAKQQRQPFRISLAQWSLHRSLFAGELDTLDFARTARHEFGIDGIEYVNQFFKDKANDEDYLAELAQRAADEGVTSVLVMCDGLGSLGDPDEKARTKAVENHFPWVEAAKRLGCHSIRVDAASKGPPEEQQKLVADGLTRLAEYAGQLAMAVLVENHGGLSSDGTWLAGVMKLVDRPNCGTLPDFGNFGDYDRYRGVEELMPFAKGVSAKSHEFDADGNEVRTDYRRMLRIVVDAGYRDWIGIEYEGKALAEPEGIRATKRLLERVRAEM